MSEVIASRQMFIKDGKGFIPSTITLSKPENACDGFFSCRVEFVSVPKYHADIKGVDSINAIQCALAYIESICSNSDDPKFFWDEHVE